MKHNIDLGLEANPAIVSDSEWMLREMLSNLIDNVLRYTQDGGTITVRRARNATGHFSRWKTMARAFRQTSKT